MDCIGTIIMNKWIIKAIQIIVIMLALLSLSYCGITEDNSQLSEKESPSNIKTGDIKTENIIDNHATESAPDSVILSEADSQTDESESDSAEASEEVFIIDNYDWITESDKQTTFGTVLITGDSVNVRSGPGTDTSILGRVHEGTILALMQNGDVDGFIKISYVGDIAYVSSELSEVLSGDSVQVASSDEKLIALTFDDGPNADFTYRILDILESEKVSATFFVLGTAAQAYPDIVKRAAEEGHEIGSHTLSHADLTTLSGSSLISEIVDAVDIIERTIGYRPSITRPPYGEYNDKVLEAIETPIIMWSIDPMDWKFPDADTIYQNIVNVAKDGDIILIHDSQNTSVLAAERIIVELKSRGFTFVTVSELLERRGDESQKVYAALRP